jgi:cell division protein FtsW
MAAIRAVRLAQAKLEREESSPVDLWLLVPALALVSLGVAMVYSASIPAVASRGESILMKLGTEVFFVLVGLAGMVAALRVKMEWLEERAWGLLLATLGLLVAVFFWPARNGAHSWIFIPHTPVSFQPSELAKLVVVIVTAKYFARFPAGLADWREALPPFLTMFVVAGLVAKEPDMGTGAVIAMSVMIYFHIAGAKMRHLAAACGLTAPLAAFVIWKHPYQLTRIVSFFKGSEVDLAGGYQKARSLIAFGSGGLTGCGYCGSVEKYFYLPAATTDSIMAVIGEELGMIFTWGVLAMFAILVWRGMQVAGRAPDRFSGLVAAGVTVLLGFQALLNIAVATGSIPATGVTLPFVSYGGSSLLVSMVSVGLLMNVSRRCKEAEAGAQFRE